MTKNTPRRSVSVLIAAIASGLSAIAGCGDSAPEQYQVSGTVTYDGKPVPAGAIYFEPGAEAGLVTGRGYGLISDGKFSTKPGRGAPPGRCTVRIRGGDGKATTNRFLAELEGSDPTVLPKVDIGAPLFPNYTTEVDLPAKDSTLELTVPVSAG